MIGLGHLKTCSLMISQQYTNHSFRIRNACTVPPIIEHCSR